MSALLNQQVLVLNRLWQAVNICTVRRALTLLFQGHAQVVLGDQDGAFETFDFWRTTRLTPHDLIVGQLCGVPLMGIWAVVCTIPVAMMAVALEISPLDLVLLYGMLLLFSATIGLAGLVMSMWAAPFRNGRGVVWFLGGYVLI